MIGMAAGKKLTQSEAESRFAERGFVLLVSYKNAHTKVAAECKRHGFVDEVMPANIFRGQGMKCCGIESATLTVEEVRKRIAARGYELVGEYRGTDERIAVKCPVHEQTFEVMARGIISDGKGLMCCAIEKTRDRMTGRDVSEKTRGRISAWQQNGNAPWANRKMTQEHCKKMSDGLIRKYRASPETNIKLAKSGKTSGKAGWFYIAKMSNGLLKFGSTTSKDHNDRFRHFATQFGQSGQLLLKCMVEDAGRYEADMMEKHRAHWVKGEFFRDFVGAT